LKKNKLEFKDSEDHLLSDSKTSDLSLFISFSRTFQILKIIKQLFKDFQGSATSLYIAYFETDENFTYNINGQ